MRRVNAFRAIYEDKSGMPEEAVATVSRSGVEQRLKRERSMPLATHGCSKPSSVRAGRTNPTPVFLRRTNWRRSPTLKINLPHARPKPSGSAGAALCSRGHLKDTISQRRTEPPTSPTSFRRKGPLTAVARRGTQVIQRGRLMPSLLTHSHQLALQGFIVGANEPRSGLVPPCYCPPSGECE